MSKRVLFVDGDEEWRARVSASFQTAGFAVTTAGDAGEALAAADQSELGLVILDVGPGEGDALMLLKFLKRNHPRVPILAVSAVDHDDKAVDALHDAGADQYQPKSGVEELIVAAGAYLK